MPESASVAVKVIDPEALALGDAGAGEIVTEGSVVSTGVGLGEGLALGETVGLGEGLALGEAVGAEVTPDEV